MIYLYVLHGLIVVVGVVTFAVYGIDKGKAKRGAWRIPEATLLTLSALGGVLRRNFGNAVVSTQDKALVLLGG